MSSAVSIDSPACFEREAYINTVYFWPRDNGNYHGRFAINPKGYQPKSNLACAQLFEKIITAMLSHIASMLPHRIIGEVFVKLGCGTMNIVQAALPGDIHVNTCILEQQYLWNKKAYTLTTRNRFYQNKKMIAQITNTAQIDYLDTATPNIINKTTEMLLQKQLRWVYG